MIDKRLFKLPKAKIMLAMLAGLMFLQAFAILGKVFFLLEQLSALGNANLLPILQKMF